MVKAIELYPGALIRIDGQIHKVTRVTRGKYTPFKMTVELEEVPNGA